MCRRSCKIPSLPTIRSAGPGGNPFFHISWISVEKVNQQGSQILGFQAESSPMRHQVDLRSRSPSRTKIPRASNHKLCYANSNTGYYSYYQSLLLLIHKGISIAFWRMSKLSLQMKHNIFHYRTGTFSVRNTMSSLKTPLASSVHSVSKQILLSIFSQGVNIQSSRV